MKKNEKKALLHVTRGVGTVVLLVGLFTPLYEFMHGLVAAIAVWILSEGLRMWLGVKKK